MLLYILTSILLFASQVVAEANCRRKYRFQLPDTLVTYEDPHRMSAWSGGGGYREKISNNTSHIFAGRQFGAGTRRHIYGSRAFGSGYSYGVTDESTIAGRPFPYGSWPLYWGGNYAGSDEYGGPVAEMQRPGGRLALVKVEAIYGSWNPSADSEVYHLIGDLDSVISIMANRVDWCRAVPEWPQAFDPTAKGSLQPENVVQYYRASSFALAVAEYRNEFALPPLNTSTKLTHAESTPIPQVLVNSSFLQCINETIATALPILDGVPFGLYGAVKIIILVVSIVCGLVFICGCMYTMRGRGGGGCGGGDCDCSCSF